MNNYSWLQQKLHQLALSSQFMREVSFDLERSFISTSTENDNHIFVAGLARSGTTILLNAIYESGNFSSLSYADMPFILAPNLWSKLSSKKTNNTPMERSHGDGIKVSLDSPEAFEEVFWKSFDDQDIESIKNFRTYVHLINQRYKKRRYLSKNNQNIRRLDLISSIFPCSKILIPFREPIQHAFSLLTQHKKFIQNSKSDKFISKYMEWIGHTEFGPNYIPIHHKNLKFEDDLDINHWIEQWCLTYQDCFQSFENEKNVHFVCYEHLCESNDYWLAILKALDTGNSYNYEFNKSEKQITERIDDSLKEVSSSLYTQLSSLDLS